MPALPPSAIAQLESGANGHLVALNRQGGAPEPLRALAPRFLGPDSGFPSSDAPAGRILRIGPDRIAGSGPRVAEATT